jgi:hypothetical protein
MGRIATVVIFLLSNHLPQIISPQTGLVPSVKTTPNCYWNNKAIAAFNQALAFDPNYAPVQEQLALLKQKQQLFDDVKD